MKRKKMAANLQAYLFVGPFVILSVVFMIYPIISSFYTTRFSRNAFVGLENYVKASVGGDLPGDYTARCGDAVRRLSSEEFL